MPNKYNIDFFITGYPRSGTTMVASLMGRNKAIFVPAESHFFRSFLITRKSISKDDFITDFLNDKRLNDIYTDREVIIKCVYDNNNYTQAFACVLHKLAADNNKNIIGEKTPSHILNYPSILLAYPDCRFIYVLRDGRDCVYSNLKETWTHNNPYKHAAEWNLHIRQMESLKKKYQDRILIVKYEDILNNPDALCAQMTSFIGVKFSAENSDESNTLTIPEWEKAWKKKASQKPDPSNMYKWKNNDNDRLNLILTKIMYNNLLKYQYDTTILKSNDIKLNIKEHIITLACTPVIYSIMKHFAHLFRMAGLRN